MFLASSDNKSKKVKIKGVVEEEFEELTPVSQTRETKISTAVGTKASVKSMLKNQKMLKKLRSWNYFKKINY